MVSFTSSAYCLRMPFVAFCTVASSTITVHAADPDLLQDYGMSPDVDGQIPLAEALIARDPATVKLLLGNEATLQNANRRQLLGQAVQDSC